MAGWLACLRLLLGARVTFAWAPLAPGGRRYDNKIIIINGLNDSDSDNDDNDDDRRHTTRHQLRRQQQQLRRWRPHRLGQRTSSPILILNFALIAMLADADSITHTHTGSKRKHNALSRSLYVDEARDEWTEYNGTAAARFSRLRLSKLFRARPVDSSQPASRNNMRRR